MTRSRALILVAILALMWGLISWYWYACEIRGLCDAPEAAGVHAVEE